MKYPDFFDLAPRVRLRDPLSDFLGSFEGGIIEYGYIDAVKLAGHSCPTVAGAYLMTLRALEALFGDDVAERGAVRVSFSEAADSGVTGVMASVAGLLTGAAGEGGFKGIGDRFNRQGLLTFATEVPGEIVYERMDTGARVAVTYSPHHIPLSDEARQILGRLIAGAADAAEAARFKELWQGRVRAILIDHVGDADLIQVTAA